MKLWYWLLKLLFPPKCVLCGKVLSGEETDLCRICRVETPAYPSFKRKVQFLDSFVAVWYYEGYVRESLLRYKFRRERCYAGAYGRFLAMKLLQEHPEGFDVLTWIPVSPLRRFTRGYDQVELLAAEVGRELGMTPVPLLKKIRHNRPQSRITGAAHRRANVLGVYRAVHRRANVLGVYRAVSREAIAGKRILLLDDILTTGATAGEAASVLLTAGAKEVHCGAVAASRNK